jgi:DNA repair exonuclease SbcCD nuclease subunit
MSAPYAILSDIHCHDWSAFGSTDATGVSTRLRIILSEIDRAADELEKAGGRLIVLAGDLFHTRGSINPEVLNPLQKCIEALTLRGFQFVAIPGNHDLKSKETKELSNAIQTLNSLDGFEVVNEPKVIVYHDHMIALVPWCSTNEGLRKAVAEIHKSVLTSETDLIIHAGIDGILTGMPDHGLTAAEVASWGFKRAFAGHYHHHKVMEDGKVISIGATTHQTWSDVGSQAGFLLVYPKALQFRASHAPSFVEINETTEEEDIPLIVDENYVRVRGKSMTDEEINELRRWILSLGAKGFLYQGIREVVSARPSGATHKSVSLETSIGDFIKAKVPDPIEETAIAKMALDVLAEVRARTE